MRHAIVLAPEAVEDLRRLPGPFRAMVKTAMEKHLRHEPGRVSKSRIKRLRGVRRPGYRLRVGEIRVFYDLSEGVVEVLAIVPQAQAQQWLSEWGEAQ
ncbi:MAG: type II toxin-antitoxin system RelE/ParE family toxin [Acidobacteria bacterium]|nr:type II toxin-antitoxin system RelE/ParE family toxin [Acidobacteriota bacterium]